MRHRDGYRLRCGSGLGGAASDFRSGAQVLPLDARPLDPEQGVARYGSHLAYGALHIPLIVAAGRLEFERPIDTWATRGGCRRGTVAPGCGVPVAIL